MFWRWLTVSSVFAGRNAWTSYSSLPDRPSIPPSLIRLMVSVDVNHDERKGRERHAVLRSCVKVEVTVLGSPSLIVRTVSVGVKQN